ncbi:MAG: hypothetical protein GXY46_00445 [Actinobacteria bacterium]|nr:hypothetical protein [Actinomycetota bacterium]
MSKKETRRAARQAFPQAKNPPSTRSRYDTRATRPRNSKSRTSTARTLKPPSVKKAAIQGVIVAVLYFVFIQWIWTSGATTGANALIAALAFVLFTGVAYWVDKFKYQRNLRKSQNSSK